MTDPKSEAPTLPSDDALLETIDATPTSAQVRTSRPPDAPRLSSRYQNRALLGSGGMGSVHLCLDRRVGREVAVKSLLASGEEAEPLRARFLHEARVQGVLEHPAIVPVHDIDVDEEGCPYFTMKRVRGRTLGSILASDELPRHKLLSAFQQACLAIDFAHTHGFVHRDLKPANLMLGEFGEVYVLDWGLAKRIGEDDAKEETSRSLEDEALVLEASPHTRAGAVLGTPGYMSPEQVRGAPIDARSDVYSLGVVLYELLTRETLHTGTSALALMKSTLSGAEIAIRDRFPDVAPELEAAVKTATALDPEKRFASARALSDAIDRYLSGDRDIALRRELADRHASAAQEAAAEATSDEARRRALREVGRALALDPEHPAALATMWKLMTEPPPEMPPEVRRELDALATEQNRIGGRNGAIAFGAFALISFPLGAVLGIESPLAVLAMAVTFASAAAASFTFWRSAAPQPRHSMIVLVLSSIAFATMSVLFGPFVGVPTMLAANSLVFTISNERRYRAFIVTISALACVAPIALELAGLVPPSFRFEDGTIALVPRAVSLDPLPTFAVLTFIALCSIVISNMMLAPFRDQLDEAQRRVRTLAWQLRQLVPEDALKDDQPKSKP